MSRRDSGYRPTSFSMRSITTGQMTTRGAPTPLLPEESSGGADSPAIPDLDQFVAELQVSDEILHSIQKLPSTVAELRLPSTVDCLAVHELQTVLEALNVSVSTIDFLKGSRGSDKRDRAGQKKMAMLNLLATKFGEQWPALHELLRQKKTASSPARRRKQSHDSTGAPFDIGGLDFGFRPLESALNSAISSVYQSDALPSRESLIFLSDSEYESVKQFHAAMHPRGVPAADDCGETAAIEYLFGTLKETTAALEAYYDLASTARLYVERLVRHHEEHEHAYADGKLFLMQGDQESSEDQGELGNE